MAKFAYNNAKNASIIYTSFELNCGYYPRISFKEDTNPRSQFKTANKLSAELQKLTIVCQENLYRSQKLQKHVYNKAMKPKSYASGNKV